MAEPTEKRSFRDLLRVAFRRRIPFLFGAATFAFLVLLFAHWWPLKYTGITKFQRQSDPAAKATGSESFESIKLNLQHDLAGQQAVEQVIQDLGLTRGFPRSSEGELTREGELAKQGLVAAIQKTLQITWEVRSLDLDLVSVSVTNSDPKLARMIPDALVKNYIEKTSLGMQQRLTASRDFLLKQVADNQGRLTELEKQRIDFETKNAKQMPESPGAVQKEIDRVEATIAADTLQRQDAEIRLWAAQKKLDQLKKEFSELADVLLSGAVPQASTQPATQPATRPASLAASQPASMPAGAAPTVAASQPTTQPVAQPSHVAKAPNPEYERIQTQLRQERDLLDSARIVGRMKDTHPRVQAMLAKIDSLKKLLDETPTHIDMPIYATTTGGSRVPVVPGHDPLRVLALTDAASNVEFTKRDIENVNRRLEVAEARRRELLALMANFVPIRQQWQEITEKIQNQQAELTKWNTRLEEVQMSLAAEVAKRRTHLEAVQAAQEQILPSSPNLLLILAFALGGSAAFAAGLVFLLNLLDRSVTTTEDALEYFGLPVHGVIGEIIPSRQRRIRKMRRLLVTPIACAIVLACVGTSALSIVLRLQFPDAYEGWRSAPVTFLYKEGIQRGVTWVSQLL